MAKDKKSFIGYCDWERTFDFLSDEEAGKLIKHFFAYINDKDPILEDRLLQMAFEPIKLQLNRDLSKYEEVKRKRSEAGRQGGLKSGESRGKQSEPIDSDALSDEANASFASNAKQNEANEAVTDTVIVTVNDTVTDILLEKETKEGEFEESIQEEIFETDKQPDEDLSKKVAQKKVFRPPSVQQVQEYCNERKNNISGYEFVTFYQSKGWMIGKNKMKDWQAAVRTWEAKRNKDGNNQKTGSGSSNIRNGNDKVSGTTEILGGARYTEFT
ncbi:Uncharacterised protein [Elizabethkingia miricola]|uniref:DUF6291 domain-containing protein n=1 Tax=Elizabethkingia miricola TaxID=172045 RepID=A0ABD4DPK4_ELIMR|nr:MULTISPECIES: DUF6291 domain-containing protein [Elizabethkingia]KUY20871.1 hypothetical protein ATB95_08215 [Elizabethkingia miricola]MCL1652918.1 DUF6291 domain-containing protein [Elizabethkingia miricola]QNV11272.1 hypothetical protein EIY88_18900 [Elizabethkingia anophelis]SPW34248.1 Uncharacterised protein [Elizabethkingia miricola]